MHACSGRAQLGITVHCLDDIEGKGRQITVLVHTVVYIYPRKFPEKVKQALDDYEPSVVTRYIIELCTEFNRFYHNCPVLTAENESVKAQRLALTECTNKVLSSALELICVRHPEKI